VIPAAVHEALGVVARRNATQLNDFSARTIRAIGYNKVHGRGMMMKTKRFAAIKAWIRHRYRHETPLTVAKAEKLKNAREMIRADAFINLIRGIQTRRRL